MSEVKNKVTLYSYVKPRNKAYITKLSLDTGQSKSDCLDAVIDAIRLNRDLKIPEKKFSSLERLKRIQEKKKQEIKELKQCTK